MPQPTFSNRTYAGEFFAENMGPTVLDPAGLEDNNLATVIDRSKYKETIYESDDTIVLQDPSPLFSDQGTQADTGEVNLTLVRYDFGKEISLDNIVESWYSNDLAAGSLEDYTYDQLVDMYVADVYIPKLKQAQDNLVLNGKNGLDPSVGTYGFSANYVGLYNLFDNATGLNKVDLDPYAKAITAVVAGATTTLTVNANINDVLQAGNIISIRNATGTGWDTAINGDFQVVSINIAGTSVEIDVDTTGLNNGDYNADGTFVYINQSNIIPVLATHQRRTPVQVRRNVRTIVMPEHLYLEWQYAVADAQQNGGQYYMTSHQMKMIDENLVVLDNAPANTLGTWDSKRVFYGYDLSTDYSTIEALWQGATTGDKVYRLQGKMKTGMAITSKFEREITLTTPDA